MQLPHTDSNQQAVKLNRDRCYDCYRPRASCFCHAIPDIENTTQIVIVQHQRERFHAFNTARIVYKALRRCRLLSHRFDLETLTALASSPNTGLLFPSPEAQLISAPTNSQPLSQLILIDGTWHHAKTMMRDIPVLRELPCFKLAPSSPGQYRIRKEPNSHSLSTLEATVQALRVLEPETAGLDKLFGAFESMVDTQLDHPQEKRLRRNRRRGQTPLNIPVSLARGIEDIVVAYGEAAPRDPAAKRMAQTPVYWVAERLSNGERFSATIQTSQPLPDSFLNHFQVARSHFRQALDEDAFRLAWREFMEPSTLLAVYHPSTERMLANIDANCSPCIALRAIDYAPFRVAGALEQVIEAAGIEVEPSGHTGRAGLRLAMAKALILRLHRLAKDWFESQVS